jgi:hypothetical protein
MQCADCLSDLDDALILICDHNLCLACAASKASGGGSIKCKICSSVTNLDPGSAQQLREMFPQLADSPVATVPSIATQMSPPARPPPLPLHRRPPIAPGGPLTNRSLNEMPNFCGQCDRSKAADLRCLQCEELLCFDCSDSLHRRGKMTSHHLIPLSGCAPMVSSNSPMNRSVMSSMSDRTVITMRSVSCSTHTDVPIQYFCLRCETRPMCAECVFRSPDHQSHLSEVVLIKKAFPKIRARINDMIIGYEKSIKEIRTSELSLVENKKSVENVGATSKIQIDKYFNEIRESLRRKQDELVAQVEQVVDKEVTDITREIFACTERREKLESVSKLLNSVRDSSVETLSSEREVEVLDSFSEMKTIISESNNGGRRKFGSMDLVQLFVPPDSINIMNSAIREIKGAIVGLPGVVPTRTMPMIDDTVTNFEGQSQKFYDHSDAVSSVGSVTSRKRRVRRGSSSTANDMHLISAINDAIRSG